MSKDNGPSVAYRKVEMSLWSDAKFMRLSKPQPNAQTLWQYLITGPRSMNIPGIVVAREAVMADDLRWPLEGFREAFAEVIREGMVEADRDAGVVVLKRALFDGAGRPRSVNRPQSINVVLGWAKRWNDIPECNLKESFYWELAAFLEAIGEAYADAFQKACPKPSRIQEQEQKQEQKEESVGPRAVLAPVLHGEPEQEIEAVAPPAPRKPRAKKAPGTPEQRTIAARAIAALAETSGVAYEADAACNLGPVIKLLDAGRSLDDLLVVVADRAKDWRGDEKMHRYLRPETVFGSKFGTYLAQARSRGAAKPEADDWRRRRDEELAARPAFTR